MISDIEQLSLYTVPSVWINDEHGELDTPYKRVVGLRRADQREISWSKINPNNDINSAYKSLDSIEEVFEMPSTIAQLMGSFYLRYFVELTGRIETEVVNCHRFGYWMKRLATVGNMLVPNAPDFVTQGPTVNGSLGIGETGVIGSCGTALHTVVGLGKQRSECIQVVAYDGYMGIDSYQNVLESYDPENLQDLDIYKW
jgi:hypothetical protein